MGVRLKRDKGQALALSGHWANVFVTRKPKIQSFMTNTPDMSQEDAMRVRLGVLQQEHRDLDEAIRALQDKGTADALTLQRLKRHKLRLKDEITSIENRLTPDIIA